MNKPLIHFFLICLTLITVGNVSARQLSVNEAIARTNAGTSGAKGHHPSVIDGKLCYTSSDTNGNLFYVINKTNGGFIIASADDLAPALLAYGDGTFDANNIPEPTKAWLENYAAIISNAISTGKTITMVNDLPSTPVEPLIKTAWGQSKPYNNDCPIIDGQHALTGCVPLATTALMHYHKVGNFNWNDMRDYYGYAYVEKYNDYRYNEYSDDEEGLLDLTRIVHEIGEGIGAVYGISATGGRTDGAIGYICQNYGYDKGAETFRKEIYSDKEWQMLILEELYNARPVIYSGTSSTVGGHTFICDGYDGNGFFHMNWGWTGQSNAYYAVIGDNAVFPDKSVPSGFLENQEIITKIQRNKGTRDYIFKITHSQYETFTDNTFTKQSTTFTQGSPIYVNASIFNGNIVDNNICIAAKFTNTETGDVFYSLIANNLLLRPSEFFRNFSIKTSDILINGSYKISFIYKKQEQNLSPDQWQVMPEPYGVEAPVVEITGIDKEPAFILTKPAYITREDNLTTLDDIQLHCQIKALSDVSNKMIIAFIYPAEGGSSLTYFQYNLKKANKNQIIDINIPVNSKDNLEEGKTYLVDIMDYYESSYLTPSLYVPSEFKIVSKEFFNRLPGDANDDGIVTIADANLVMNYILGNVSESGINKTNADIDNNGIIDKVDADMIIEKYLFE
ncbi:MAG: C10 family peptidase [Prevotella sp.]|nr:C10 family peptidase [Candidatus Prevotella equi]